MIVILKKTYGTTTTGTVESREIITEGHRDLRCSDVAYFICAQLNCGE